MSKSSHYLMHLEKVKPEDIWNIDETACRLLPQASRGWALSGSQIIYDGKTTKSIPPGPRDELNIAAVSECHFSTTDSLLQLVGCLQNQVKGEKFICILDCAPTHTSAAFREKVKKEAYPRCVLCYIQPRETACTQSLGLVLQESKFSNESGTDNVEDMPELQIAGMGIFLVGLRPHVGQDGAAEDFSVKVDDYCYFVTTHCQPHQEVVSHFIGACHLRFQADGQKLMGTQFKHRSDTTASGNAEVYIQLAKVLVEKGKWKKKM
eukprot:1471377-Amphidinium_carterae.1